MFSRFDMPIDVIMPAHNAGKTIEQTLNSLVNQSFKDFNLIIINNGSTDNTLDIINKFRAVLDIQVINSPINLGVSKAKNLALNEVKANYVAYLDADDLWEPDKLEKQFKSLEENPQAILSYCWTKIMSNEGFSVSEYKTKPTTNTTVDLLRSNFIISGSIPMVNMKLVGEERWNEDYPTSQDWDYWLRLSLIGEFVLVPECLISYRITTGAQSSRIEKRLEDNFHIVESFFISHPEYAKYRPMSKSFNWLHGAMMCSQRTKDYSLARRLLLRAVRTNPRIIFNFKFIKTTIKSLK